MRPLRPSQKEFGLMIQNILDDIASGAEQLQVNAKRVPAVPVCQHGALIAASCQHNGAL